MQVGGWSHQWQTVLKNRTRLGLRRIRANISPLLQITIGAVLAYSFCYFVLGHSYPFLAAVAAAVGTGVTPDRRLRRATEYGLGASSGVLAGELMAMTFGQGIWQLAVVMFIGMFIGTMIGAGGIFITQIGLQSVYVVTVPAAMGAQPFDRTVDALIGALVAIGMALVVPHDARKLPRYHASTLVAELSEVMIECGDALARGDAHAAKRSLSRARDTQSMLDTWKSSLRISEEATRINARSRRYAAEVTRLTRSLKYADRSMRTLRVVVRRAVTMTKTESPRPALGEVLMDLGEGANRLRIALQRGTSRVPAEEYIAEVARRLDPYGPLTRDMQDQTLILLLRPLAVDLLQTAGADEETAHEQLPSLKGDTPEGPTAE